MGFSLFSPTYPSLTHCLLAKPGHTNLFQEVNCPEGKDHYTWTITHTTDLAIYLLLKLGLYVHMWGYDLGHGIGI